MPIDAATEDFFRLRLDHMIDLRHALAVLASRMPWQQIEASVSHVFSGKLRAGKKLSGIDLFGEQIQIAAQQSNAGRPRVPLRTMIALLYLKHAFNESDEGVVQRWSETPVWQYFGGRAYFDQALPCGSTTLVKFRALLGEDGVEALLSQTITAAVNMKLISAKELATVVVDSTVQPKAKPYDGHTLNEQLQQAGILMQETGQEPLTAYVDLGYRGVDADSPRTAIKHRGKYKSLSDQERKLLKRRQAIEPIIGHLKTDHRMDRCYLKGEKGDRLNAVLCAAGYNIKWLLRMIAKKGMTFLRGLYLRLCEALGAQPNWTQALHQLTRLTLSMPASRLAIS